MIRIATAGWSIPVEWQKAFPEGETHLHSYAKVLHAVEIDRTFQKTPMDALAPKEMLEE